MKDEEIVARLRQKQWHGRGQVTRAEKNEAADRIEALAAQVEVLEGAVKRAATVLRDTTQMLGEIENTGIGGLPYRLKDLKLKVDLCIMEEPPIREALKAKEVGS